MLINYTVWINLFFTWYLGLYECWKPSLRIIILVFEVGTCLNSYCTNSQKIVTTQKDKIPDKNMIFFNTQEKQSQKHPVNGNYQV